MGPRAHPWRCFFCFFAFLLVDDKVGTASWEWDPFYDGPQSVSWWKDPVCDRHRQHRSARRFHRADLGILDFSDPLARLEESHSKVLGKCVRWQVRLMCFVVVDIVESCGMNCTFCALEFVFFRTEKFLLRKANAYIPTNFKLRQEWVVCHGTRFEVLVRFLWERGQVVVVVVVVVIVIVVNVVVVPAATVFGPEKLSPVGC